jgi:hypothetical protein
MQEAEYEGQTSPNAGTHRSGALEAVKVCVCVTLIRHFVEFVAVEFVAS